MSFGRRLTGGLLRRAVCSRLRNRAHRRFRRFYGFWILGGYGWRLRNGCRAWHRGLSLRWRRTKVSLSSPTGRRRMDWGFRLRRRDIDLSSKLRLGCIGLRLYRG